MSFELSDREKGLIETLRLLRDESLLGDLAASLREVCQAVRDSGKNGKITLALIARPASKNGGAAVNLSADIKRTIPEPPTRERLFFVADDGAPVRHDPNQRALPLEQE